MDYINASPSVSGTISCRFMRSSYGVIPVTSAVKTFWLLVIITAASAVNLSCQGQSRVALRESAAAGSQSKDTSAVRFTSFSEAMPVLQAFSAALPDELLHAVAARDAAEWDKYVRSKDAEIRKRLHAGDLDTLANLLLFGTSYTSAPPLTPELLKGIRAAPAQSAETNLGNKVLLQRLDDLTAGLARPSGNERLKYFHDLLEREHYPVKTPQELLKVKQFLGSNLVRMLHEDASYAAALAEAQRTANTGFEKRSQIFAERGISLDTSLFPNYAIEEALIRTKRQGLLSDHIKKVGVIGPGLDIVNKDEGLDFYPEQTIQPFLLADTLVRLGFADAVNLEITTFDISSLVNEHLSSIRSHAKQGTAYTVQLPIRSDIEWTPSAIAYWKRAGTTLGRASAPIMSGRPTPLKYKAVSFPSAEVLHIHPIDLDVIYQRKIVPESEHWDLIIATNMFVYYGSFEQAIAMSNIASMLTPRGVLLTNDVLPDLPSLELRAAVFSETLYSSRIRDGDRVTAYHRHRVN